MESDRRRWYLPTVFAAFALCSTLIGASQERPPTEVAIYVTDFGVRNLQPSSISNGHSEAASSQWVVAQEGRFLLTPPGSSGSQPSFQQALSHWREELQVRTASSLETGVREVEFRLEASLEWTGSVPSSLQINREAYSAAYKAVGGFVQEVAANGMEPVLIYRLGGSGAAAFCENISIWRSGAKYIRKVTFYDGWATTDAVARSIEALGERQFQFVSTLGNPFFWTDTVSNVGNLRQIKLRFPEVTAYVLEPLDPSRFAAPRMADHPVWFRLPSMQDLRERFSVREVVSDGVHTALLKVGQFPAAMLAEGPISEMRVGDVDGRLAEGLDVVADKLDEVDAWLTLAEVLGFEDAAFPPEVKLLGAAARDIRMRLKGQPSSVWASHLVEEFGRVGFSRLRDAITVLVITNRLPVGYLALASTFGLEDIIAASVMRLSGGPVSIEEITLFLNGFSKLTASLAAVAVFLAFGPEVMTATALIWVISTAAKVGSGVADSIRVLERKPAAEMFQRMANSSVRRVMLEQWSQAQRAHVAHGQPIQSIVEMLHFDNLEDVGFDHADLEAWDQDVKQKREIVEAISCCYRLELNTVAGIPTVRVVARDALRAADSAPWPPPAGPSALRSRPFRQDLEVREPMEPPDDDCDLDCPPPDNHKPCPFPFCKPDDSFPIDFYCSDGSLPPCGQVFGAGGASTIFYCPDGSLPPCDEGPGGGGPSTMPANDLRESVEMLFRGYENLAAGLYPEASEAFSVLSDERRINELQGWASEISTTYPKNAVVSILVADVRTRARDFEGALESLAGADSVRPLLPLVHDLRGMVFAFGGDLPAAAQEFDWATQEEPDFVDAIVNRGSLHILAGDYDAAVRVLSDALRLEPGHGIALNARGVAHALLGEWDSAEADFAAVLATSHSENVALVAGNLELMKHLRVQASALGGKTKIPFVQVAPSLTPRGGVSLPVDLHSRPEADFSQMFGASGISETPQSNFIASFTVFPRLVGAAERQARAAPRNP